MNGSELIADTNILLFLLSGDESVANTLQGNRIYVSFITEMELLSYEKITEDELIVINKMLADITIIELDESIKRQAITFRRENNLKLPDAIIAATAKIMDLPLFTADSDFKKLEDLQLLIYET